MLYDEIFVDTNVLYNILEISNRDENVKNDDLTAFLRANKSINIPSIALCEILVHYRNNRTVLAHVISTINNYGFKVRDTEHMKLSGFNSLISLTSEDDVIKHYEKFRIMILGSDAVTDIDECTCNGILDEKISLESDYMELFFSIVYIYSIFYSSVYFFDSSDDSSLSFFSRMKTVLSILKKVNIKCYKKVLTAGYAANSEKKDAMNIFYHTLEIAFDILVNTAKCFGNTDCKRIRIFEDKLQTCKKEPMKIFSHLKDYFDKHSCSKTEEQFKEVNAMIVGALEGHGIGKTYIDYILFKLDRWQNDGGKFDKNDIIDMLILIGSDTAQSTIIDFDKECCKFLKKNKPKSYELTSKFMMKPYNI